MFARCDKLGAYCDTVSIHCCWFCAKVSLSMNRAHFYRQGTYWFWLLWYGGAHRTIRFDMLCDSAFSMLVCYVFLYPLLSDSWRIFGSSLSLSQTLALLSIYINLERNFARKIRRCQSVNFPIHFLRRSSRRSPPRNRQEISQTRKKLFFMYDHISAARFLGLLSFSVYKIRDYIITYVVSRKQNTTTGWQWQLIKKLFSPTNW